MFPQHTAEWANCWWRQEPCLRGAMCPSRLSVEFLEERVPPSLLFMGGDEKPGPPPSGPSPDAVPYPGGAPGAGDLVIWTDPGQGPLPPTIDDQGADVMDPCGMDCLIAGLQGLADQDYDELILIGHGAGGPQPGVQLEDGTNDFTLPKHHPGTD